MNSGKPVVQQSLFVRLRSDCRVALALARGMPRDGAHAERLERFYAGQAKDYDQFRQRLLPGRDTLYQMLDVAPDSVLVELGGGTAAGLHHLGSRIHDLAAIHVVDCCPSLLAQARQRRDREGWDHLQCHQADATTWRPPQGVDVVVLSYALTMMPTWEAVLANAVAMLPIGGRLAVVDFHLSAANPPSGRVRHGTLRRWFWQRWFAHDGVHLDHRRLDTIYATLTVETLMESDHRLPWLPLRVPYYCCVARKTG